MEKNKRQLQKQINELQNVEAPDIWSGIQTELNSEGEQNKTFLTQSIGHLRTHEAPDVWLQVRTGLDMKRPQTVLWQRLALAASVSLLAVCAYLLGLSKPNETISYSSEIVEGFEVGYALPEISSNADDLILKYIQENCTRLAITCQDPEFKALLEAYMELHKTKETLNQSILENTQQPQLMKYLIRVEKNQNELGKDMLKKLKEI